jgi:iron complex transport system permease protein
MNKTHVITEKNHNKKHTHSIRTLPVVSVIALVLVVVFFLSFIIGRYQIPAFQGLEVLLSQVLPIEQTWPDIYNTVMLQIRLPRILAAVLIGAGLAVSGASFQGLFRNPLVSPDILGVAAGAGFGAALGIIVFSGNPVAIQITAFLFSLIAVAITWAVSHFVRSNPTLTLILAGMAIAALFTSLLSFMKYIADPFDELPAIVFWLMGSLSGVKMSDVLIVAGPMVIGIVILLLLRWRLNVLAMGEEESLSLGVDTKKMQFIIVICSTLITASAVSIAGVIGWVGLVIPHIGRIIVGPSHDKLLPVTFLLGAVYLLLIDTLTRSIFSMELPIGILTAIIGVPFFIYLLNRGRRSWI